MKQLNFKLRSNPNSRCSGANKSFCVNQVKKGSTVFIHVTIALYCKVNKNIWPLLIHNFSFKIQNQVTAAMGDDYRETRQCSVVVAKNVFATTPESWAVPKYTTKSQLFESLNLG